MKCFKICMLMYGFAAHMGPRMELEHDVYPAFVLHDLKVKACNKIFLDFYLKKKEVYDCLHAYRCLVHEFLMYTCISF